MFDDFQTFNDPQLIEMKTEANRFVCDMLDRGEPRWLSLLGTSGAGKTMLARKISQIFREQIRGQIIYQSDDRIDRAGGGFKSWPLLINEVRDGEHRLFHDICHDWFVALDDVGAEHASQFGASKLYQFVSAREKKWTVFTGNLSLEQLSQVDTRIASRMIRFGSTVVDVDVPDFNLR